MTASIQTPAGFAPAYAIGFAGADQSLQLASSEQPLPVALATPPTAPALAGTTAASLLAGPFVPVTGRAIMLTLAGDWQGTVTLLRSTDGGTTRHPVTAGGLPWGSFTANACEAVWEEFDPLATLYLELEPASGTISYRMGH